MKKTGVLIFVISLLSFAPSAGAEAFRSVNLGDTEIVYDYETTETGVAILTLIGVVGETNNSLRGIKNSDPRRLSKLGQLIYQCKLVISVSGKSGEVGVNDPVLISKNYGLFTGVDQPLAADERIRIRIEALRAVDDASLLSDVLDKIPEPTGIWQTVSDGSAMELKQFNVELLNDKDLIQASESIEIAVRFPVFQLEKPVKEWTYNFALGNFKQAVRRIDEDCVPARFVKMIEQNG